MRINIRTKISIMMIIQSLQELVLATMFFNLLSTFSILLWASSMSTCRESSILFCWFTSTLKFWFSSFILEIIPPRTSRCSSWPDTRSFYCFKSYLSSNPRVDGSSPSLSRQDSRSSKLTFFCPELEEIIPKVVMISCTVLSDLILSYDTAAVLFCFSF